MGLLEDSMADDFLAERRLPRVDSNERDYSGLIRGMPVRISMPRGDRIVQVEGIVRHNNREESYLEVQELGSKGTTRVFYKG